jgi:hypothetical protein
MLTAVGQGQRAHDPRAGAAGVDRSQSTAGDGEQRRAVGLDYVGLVDPGLLHVGGREVLALHGVLALGGGRHLAGLARAAGDRLQRVALGVLDQVRAGGKGGQPRSRCGAGRQQCRTGEARRQRGGDEMARSQHARQAYPRGGGPASRPAAKAGAYRRAYARIGRMDDAVARYRAASEANDVEGLLDTLAPDAEVVSPISGRMVFRGREDLRVLLGAVYGGITGLRWHEEVGDGPVRVVVGDAGVGPIQLGDAMVFELAADGRIQRISPHIRPWLALTFLALKLAPTVARHPGLVRRALRQA